MSWGIDIRFNAYIHPLLGAKVRQIGDVDVMEIDGTGQRAYRVPLRHAAD